MKRVVALGASNLTRGLQAVTAVARAAWGPDVELLAALGHGRSYGATSHFLARTMPGILHSALWPMLERLPPAPTRALVTDIGNDIVYGYSAEQTLAWVDEALGRLQTFTSDVVITDLPIDNLRRLSNSKFLLFRSLFAPRCRLSLGQVVDASARVNDGLAALAAARGAQLVPLNPEWYGFDPIHVRPAMWRRAWQDILGVGATAPTRATIGEWLRLYLMRPERQQLFGIEWGTPQHGTPLPAGGRLWLY